MNIIENLRVALFQRYARFDTAPVPVTATEEVDYDRLGGTDNIYTVTLTWKCYVKIDGMVSGWETAAKEQVVSHFTNTLYKDLRQPLNDLRYAIDTNSDSRQRLVLLDALNKVEEMFK